MVQVWPSGNFYQCLYDTKYEIDKEDESGYEHHPKF